MNRLACMHCLALAAVGIISGIASATGTARLLLYHVEKETGARFKYVSFRAALTRLRRCARVSNAFFGVFAPAGWRQGTNVARHATRTEPSAVHVKLTLSLVLAGLAVLFVVQNVGVAEV